MALQQHGQWGVGHGKSSPGSRTGRMLVAMQATNVESRDSCRAALPALTLEVNSYATPYGATLPSLAEPGAD
jgi:hypothetical protein